LTGTSDEKVAVHRRLSDLLGHSLPDERLTPAQFPLPSPEAVGDIQRVHLLWQAARLLLREGAAPLRAFGRISVRPRTYQLVPLLMALRLNPVRLLIADDVGVGKTIEAGLIVRELWERGEITRLAVLCPPYLCDQWQKELSEKFHLEAEVIHSATIGRLERRTPPGRTVYEHFPVQVISIDFIKHKRNKHAFLLHAPELLIIDEAHSVTPGRSADSHLRYELVQELAQDLRRHLLLLTATPHSGIPEAFQKLLGLLAPAFAQWDFTRLGESQRACLARHFVQRTRKDIQSHWEEGAACFPERQPIDKTYVLSPAYRELFEAVYKFCTEIVASGHTLAKHQRRMRWWGALALLRCVMSSPRAAKEALHKRRQGQEPLTGEEASDDLYAEMEAIYEPDDRLPTDELPTALLHRTQERLTDSEKRRLRMLEQMAKAISDSEDNKLTECLAIVRGLLAEGFHPIIWCYYVETAEYVAEKLAATLAAEPGGWSAGVRVLCLTGRIGEEERRRKVEELMAHPGGRVLVATDCLSEGINLQEGFNAVIHYDLPWNPNRLEQREGRVDRYGQPSPTVKVVRFYGRDNPVDGAVIQVLLDKARHIRQVLGTYVPIPQDEEPVVDALVHALFIRRARPQQLELAFADDPTAELHRKWDIDMQREKESRTRFAQHALKPEEVRREMEATDQVLGDPAAVRTFVLSACQQLGLQVRPSRRQADVWEVITEPAALVGVPEGVCRALPADRKGRWTVTFSSPTPEGAEYLGRNHPFVVALARYLFEQAFAGMGEPVAARCGAIRTRLVEQLTALLLLRVRFLLHQPRRAPLLAEEVLVLGWHVFTDHWLRPAEALPLLSAEPEAPIPLAEKQELVAQTLKKIRPIFAEEEAPSTPLRLLLEERARELEAAHRRIRQSIGDPVRNLQVELHWPPDLLGLIVLQPTRDGTL
jgi:superfamily II DNA or RNA helicase